MRKFPIVGIVTFISLFIYFYLKSGKFRKSITTAILIGFILSSWPSESRAESFSLPQHQVNRRRLSPGLNGAKNNNLGKPNNGGPGGDDNGDDGLPQCPKTESLQDTEQRLEDIEELLRQMDESSDSEEEQCKVGERITSVVSKDGSRTKGTG